MNAVPAWVLYSVLRVLAFVIPLALLLLLGLPWWLAALVAAVIGFCLSYLFLRGPRERVALSLAESRSRRPERPHGAPADPDADAEDASLRRDDHGA